MVQPARRRGRERRADRRQGGRRRLSAARRDHARRARQRRDATRAGHSRARARRGSTRGSPIGSARSIGSEARGRRRDARRSRAIIAQEPEIAGLTFAPGPKLLLNLRRRAGDESAAAGQPRDVATAGRRARRRGELDALSRVARPSASSRGSASKRCATCGRKCGRRSSAPSTSWASRRSSPCCSPRSPSRSPRRATCAAISTRPRCSAASARRSRTTLALFVIQFAVLGVAASALGVVGRADRPAAARRAAVERVRRDAAAAVVACRR